MVSQVLTIEYWVEVLVVIVLLLCIRYGVSVYYGAHPANKSNAISATYFFALLNNTFLVLTLLLPTLIAITAALYTSNPRGRYSTLFACITCLMGVLVVAMWFNFALPTYSAGGDKIAPDKQSMSAIGLIYILTIASIMLGMIFFLFEYSPVVEPRSQAPSEILIYRSRISLDLTREQVEKLWGPPMTTPKEPNRFRYFTPRSLILIEFNAQGKMTSMTEARKE
jgi:hypothetical protein